MSNKPTLNSYYGMGETINRLILLIMWTLSAFFWLVTNINEEWMYWFFTIWARVLHFVDMARFLTVSVMKTIGIFEDTKQDYLIDNGLSLQTGYSTNVSMLQELSGTDWYMETFGLSCSFALYGDLLGTSDWAWREQDLCLKQGLCDTLPNEKHLMSKYTKARKVAIENLVRNDIGNSPDDVYVPTEF